MCFVPQRRALFRHLNFQKWAEHDVFCTFWLGNVLRATEACTFRHRSFKKCSEPVSFLHFWLWHVLRATTPCNFSSLIWPDGSAPAAFSEPTFQPSGATNHWKNTVSRLFYLFAHLDLLSSETFSFLIFFLLLFSSLLWLFPSLLFICPYCRKFDF